MATLTGAIGSENYTLYYDNKGAAYQVAAQLIPAIDANYRNVSVYNPHGFMAVSRALLIMPGLQNHIINTNGFVTVIDENNNAGNRGDTLIGGGNQRVLAGNAGMTFVSSSGRDTIDAGGGNNYIDVGNDTQNAYIYTSSGNDTIIASQGNDVIEAGKGNNEITLGRGMDMVTVTGNDSINLGAGSATIKAGGTGSADIMGTMGVRPYTGFTLTFQNDGSGSSTVMGGAGSYSISGGNGGGVFYGANGGDNHIVGGSGDVTIHGGGAGDTLAGGSGNDAIYAGRGNETLAGGTGTNTFYLIEGTVHSNEGTVDVIKDFNTAGSTDYIGVSNAMEANYDIAHQNVVGHTDFMTLQNGTVVALDNVTAKLTISDFKF